MGQIKVILLNNLKGVGNNGDIVDVTEGYARNYLLPKNLAIIADEGNLEDLKRQNDAKKKQIEEDTKEAEEKRDIINGKSVDVFVKGGKNGKLFGSVTSVQISDAISKKFGVEVDKKSIKICDKNIKSVDSFGTYEYELNMGMKVKAKILVNVHQEA